MHFRLRSILLHVLIMLLLARPAMAEVVSVADDGSLRAAVRDAKPGVVIRIGPGNYRGLFVERLTGTAEAPIVIEAADPANPPVFLGGGNGMHLVDPVHVTIRHLVFRGQTANGLNIDDGGTFDTPAHHVTLENLRIEEVGPQGNRDGIKLSGIDDFVVRDTTVHGWAGSAIDMVGCHRGVIERCTFRGKEGFDQATGPQMKGGSSGIVVRACRFVNGGSRAVNIGGSTGLQFFRPQDAAYEAKDVTVERCTFIGSDAPVAFVGIDGAVFRHNTIYRPKRWALRILQETTGPRFVPSRNGRFYRNLVVFRSGELREAVNIGPDTAPQTFQFRENFWYCEDDPARSRPKLPADEQNGTYGVDPQIEVRGGEIILPDSSPAHDYGATAAPGKE